MRYTEKDYLAFLEKLFVVICDEHEKIGKATEAWQSSFRLLTFPSREEEESKKKQFQNHYNRRNRNCLNYPISKREKEKIKIQ